MHTCTTIWGWFCLFIYITTSPFLVPYTYGQIFASENSGLIRYSWSEQPLPCSDSISFIPTGVYAPTDSNIMVCGWSHDWTSCIYHFTNNRWQILQLPENPHVILRTLLAVDSNHIFLGGYEWQNPAGAISISPVIFLYSNRKLTRYYTNTSLPDGIVALTDASANSLTALCENGHLLHIKNGSGTFIRLAGNKIFTDIKTTGPGKYALLCKSRIENTETTCTQYFAQLTNQKFSILDSSVAPIQTRSTDFHFGESKLFLSDSGTLYSAGPALWQRDSLVWKPVFASDQPLHDMHENSSGLVLCVGERGTIRVKKNGWWYIEPTYAGALVDFQNVCINNSSIILTGVGKGKTWIFIAKL
ncbi:MAG: hypothetical protein LWX56_12575 [Ignavibacteria bacterium]|nr:hypothetical protein [Ignavibacteria bacterium]